MATPFNNINMVAFNRRQIRAAAQNLGILHDNTETPATLTAKVKAK